MRGSSVYWAVVASCVASVSCGAGSDGDDAEADDGVLRVFPEQVYSGFDGQHMYQTPVAVFGGKAVEWSVDNPALVKLAPSDEGVMLTSLAAGQTVLHAKSAGQTVSASLVITAYTAEQYKAGETRYKATGDTDNPACADCHGPGKGPDHTPTEIAQFSDDAIEHTFTTGVDLEGKSIKDTADFQTLLKGRDHMWKVADDAKLGVVAYLRALSPRGFPEDDE